MLGRLGTRELVAAFIVRMAGMTLYPLADDNVLLGQLIQLLPQIGVGQGVCLDLALSHPAILTPLVTPGSYPIQQVLTVGDQSDLAGLFEGSETLDNRLNLHPVAGGVLGASCSLHGMLTITDDEGPATTARIAVTRSVGAQHDLLHIQGRPEGDWIRWVAVITTGEPVGSAGWCGLEWF